MKDTIFHKDWPEIDTGHIQKGETMMFIGAFTTVIPKESVDSKKDGQSTTIFYVVRNDKAEVISRYVELHAMEGHSCEGHAKETCRQPIANMDKVIEENKDFMMYAAKRFANENKLDETTPAFGMLAPLGATNEMVAEVMLEKSTAPKDHVAGILNAIGMPTNVNTTKGYRLVSLGQDIKDAREFIMETAKTDPEKAIRLTAEFVRKNPELLERMKREEPKMAKWLEEQSGMDLGMDLEEETETKKTPVLGFDTSNVKAPVESPIKLQPNLIKANDEVALIKQFGKKNMEALAKKTGYNGILINPVKKTKKHVNKSKAKSN